MALRGHLRRMDHPAAVRLALERARALRALLELEQPGRYDRSVIYVEEEEKTKAPDIRGYLCPSQESGADDLET